MKTKARSVSVVVCDPCPMVYLGLQKGFEEDTRFRFTSETSDLQALLSEVSGDTHHIALIDWQMITWSELASLDVLREIAKRTKTVLLGMTTTPQERKRAFETGIRGIINKRHSPSQVRQGLSKVADGHLWFEPGDAETLLHHLYDDSSSERKHQGIKLITRREHEVIQLVCRGLRNKQIAGELYISETTVWHHLSSIFSKLGVSDRVGLVTFAFRHILHPESVSGQNQQQTQFVA